MTLVFKECKNCGNVFYDGEDVVKLTPKLDVEIIYLKIMKCHNCIISTDRTGGQRDSNRRIR